MALRSYNIVRAVAAIMAIGEIANMVVVNMSGSRKSAKPQRRVYKGKEG